MTNVTNPLHISRFLQVYDDAAAQKGIKISIGFDFHEYVSITQTTPTKNPTLPNFRPDCSPIKSGDGFWMVGVDRNNEVAILQAVRMYELSNSNLAEHLQSLKAFYVDPTVHAHPQDRCICTAQSAKKMVGKVAYHGDSWVCKNYRGQGMPKIMAGIVFGVSFALWCPDFVCGLVAQGLLDKGVVARYGYAHHESGGARLRLVEAKVMDNYWLVWLTGDELRGLVDRHGRTDRPSCHSHPHN